MFSKERYLFGETTVELLYFDDFEPSTLIHHLTEIELERYFDFHHVKRKREFVATRILRHQLFGFQHIHYDEVGAPFIEGVGNISISHTDNCVGIAYSKDYKVGLDLELIKPKITNIGHKFLNEQEKSFFEINDEVSLTKLWTIKEVLYKLSGRKELSFLKNLNVTFDSKNGYVGSVVSEDIHFKVAVNVEQFNQMIVAVNTKECEA